MSGPGKFPRVESNVPPVTQALATLAGTDHDASATSHFSLDSDLEAFSHNPTDGSFGALPVQATP